MDLRTNYLGLELANPVVPSASPLSRSLEKAKQLEDAGASAIVMYSLFEEELSYEEQVQGDFLDYQSIGHPEATSFLPMHGELPSALDRYLEQLQRLKQSLDIPVIASLNGISRDGWVEYGRELEKAGADALELNVYYVAAELDQPGSHVEQRYVDLMAELRRQVSLPIAMKLSPQLSSPGHLVRRLEEAGANGVSLFNRFYQPDIDLDSLQVAPHLHLSTSAESLLPMRWIAILFGRVNLSLAATTGIHTAADALKMILAGADVTHMCSALLQHGPGRLTEVLHGITAWLEESPYDSVEEVKGSLSQQHAPDPAAFERSNYVTALDSYSRSFGVRR